jgi:DNA-binding Lrp family transcriptional regulator
MEGFYVQKLESIKVTKSDQKIIYAIGCLTLQERKKATKTTHAQIGLFCGCSEKTVQRSVSKLEKAKLITRGRPKWKKSAWFINISADFYQETKAIFHEQKKLSTQAQNVHTGRTISINNSISSSLTPSLQKETKTEIAKSSVEFFISDKILELDLKNLDTIIGLTYSDLESISRKTGWQNRELQSSINNFALAIETQTFIATKLTPREAFISILTGNGKREPRLFNKPQELIKIETERANEKLKSETINLEETKKIQEEKQAQAVKENYWLSISDEKKQEYLKESASDLSKAIEIANSRVCTDHEEFSLSKILESLNEPKGPVTSHHPDTTFSLSFPT